MKRHTWRLVGRDTDKHESVFHTCEGCVRSAPTRCATRPRPPSAAGADVSSVQALLGHEDARVTARIYSHAVAGAQARGAARAVGEYLDRAMAWMELAHDHDIPVRPAQMRRRRSALRGPARGEVMRSRGSEGPGLGSALVLQETA